MEEKGLSPLETARKSFILGLTGSLGSGKSFVSSLFSECHASVICADKIAREVVEPGSGILSEISREFGQEILRSDGSLDRSRLAGIVFQDEAKRRKLEQLIHPLVRQRELQLIETYSDQPLVVLDIPLLYESGFDKECDKVAVVVIDHKERVRRLEADRGYGAEEISRRLAAQMPQEEKARRADFVIDNSDSRRDTARQLRDIFHQIFPAGMPAPLNTTPLDTIKE